jgi:aminoglycoside phosphotransferase (APT) family kinase protein
MTENAVDRLDVNVLGNYLEHQIAGFSKLRSAEKFAGGQSNPTFLLKADSGQYVLRRKPPGQLLASAHAVDREFKVLKALSTTPVPVANALHLCADDGIIGSMFYVMDFVEGRVFWDSALPEIEKDERAAYYRDLIRVLAAMHDVDVDAVGLGDFGKPGNYYQRQIGRWAKQYRAAETGNIPAMEKLLEWLPASIPADDGQVSLIHGDYCLANVMYHPHQPAIAAVLDWELSTLGHPFADLAYCCMRLRLPPQSDVRGLGDLDRDALGVPDEEEIIRQYCALRGIDGIDHWNFYLVFSFFRLASICQGIVKRALDGNASSETAIEVGKMTGPLAQMAVDLID